jgi:predicted RecA/RadA family phage recombinase
MKNYVQPGRTLPFIASADVKSGEGILLSATLFGVSCMDVANGATGEAMLEGVFTLPKAAVVTAAFDAAYWDGAAKKTTNVAAGNKLIGFFTEASVAGVSAAVKLVSKAA